MKSTDFPLYTTVKQPYTNICRAYACIYFAAIMALIFYRIVYIPSEGYLPWMLVFCAELGFSFIWILDQAFRWRPVSRHTFPQRLSNSFEEELPPVDIFICTADPTKEPPLYVVNTVLSNLAHHYPTEKLSCYVSDDGGSPLTFYALLEASQFAKFWVPFCRKYSIEQRCPDAYFSESDGYQNTSSSLAREQEKLKDMYEEMKYSINSTVERGAVPIDKFNDHKGFKQWSSGMTSGDHPSIVQVLLEKGKDTDMEGHDLPSLVYVSREKRPGYPHNFKAGALNVLIRVSALMSNAPFILTLDCDMYANNCEALREAMCFFMDSQTGHQLGFVQFPQRFHGITKNDLYSNHHLRVCDIQLKGIDGAEGPFYLGSGCLLRRDLVCGSEPQESTSECSGDSSNLSSGLTIVKASPYQMLNEAKTLAKCSYEDNSLWGKRVGILYGCAVEDMLTGFVIQCKGWKSTLCNPKRNAFQGHVPVNLNDSLVQNTRWAAGLLQFFVSKFCPFVYGINRVSITQRMCYGYYCLWPLSCLPIICYGLVPASCTLSSIALFPEISNPWFLLFTFLSLSAYSYSLVEFLAVGGSVKMWWNEQRMWMIRGVSSCLFGSIQVLCKLMGISEVGFEVTNKVSDSEAVKRYEDEIFEFGVASNMFIPSATLALINLIALMSGIAQVLSKGYRGVKGMVLQLTLVSFIVVNSYPILEAMLVRKDNGRMPTSLTLSSLLAAVVVCYVASYTPSW